MWVKIYGKEKSKEKGQEETGKEESKAQEEGHQKEKQAMCCEDQSRQGMQEVCVGIRQILLLAQEIIRLQGIDRFFLSYDPPRYI